MLDEEEKTITTPLAEKSREVLEPGAQLGQYKIIRLLGRGGMGEVYEAEHTTLGINFALKLLPPDLLATPSALERFRREARVMAQLRHPHILHVDDFGETAGHYWLRMELANGAIIKGQRVISLADLTEVYGGRIEQKILLGILQQLVSGLGYAHGKGLVHRDLKPSNILICSDESGSSFKISDFGLVRLVGAEWLQSRVENSVRLSSSLGDQPTVIGPKQGGASTRSLLGTYEYMSPEQKRGEEADARSDIYSLGLMTFRLLTGQRELGFELPSDMDEHLVPAWDAVIKNSLQPRREKRVIDCAALSRLLEEVASALSQGSEKPAAPVSKVRKIETPAPVTEARKPGESMTVDLGGGVKMDFAWIPGGEYLMGSQTSETGRAADETQHRVTISKGFWIGKTEVTQAQWERVMGSNPSCFKGAKLPMESVSWNDCQEFIKQLNGKSEMGNWKASLPTEAQWEYTCRAGTTTPFHFGNSLDASMANFDGRYPYGSGAKGEYRLKTTEVGSFRPNAWGLYDMHGNVWEWCQDWYGPYGDAAVTDPTGPASGSFRVLRGGSWFYNSGFCRSAYRLRLVPVARRYICGLRLVLLVR